MTITEDVISSFESGIWRRPQPGSPIEDKELLLVLKSKLFSSATINDVIATDIADQFRVEVRTIPYSSQLRNYRVPFSMKMRRRPLEAYRAWIFENSPVKVILHGRPQVPEIIRPGDTAEQIDEVRSTETDIGNECLSAGRDSNSDMRMFKAMVQQSSGYYLHILCLEQSNEFFMCHRPDTHFEIKALAPLAHFDKLDGLKIYSQVYSFRFPKLGSVQMCCELRQVVRVEADGQVHEYIRGAVTDIFDYCESFLHLEDRHRSEITMRVYNPAVFAFRACQYADTFGNSVIVEKCIHDLKSIEGKLGDAESATSLSAELNELSKELGQVRICIQYVKAAVSTLLSHLEGETDRNYDTILSGSEFKMCTSTLPTMVREGLWRSQVGIETTYSIASLEKTCDQRLLDIELIQRRADNALTVVTNLLAQKEIEWQHSAENSQKTIAIVTMFFLPATFFAILFTVPLFNWDNPDEPVVRRKIWIYWVFTGVSTIAIFALYFFWDSVKKMIPSRYKKSDEESQSRGEVHGSNRKEKQK